MTARPVLGALSFALRDASRPLLVLGPSLGTSVTALWQDVVGALVGDVDVVGWDLPGHGAAPRVVPADLEGLEIADLAQAVLGVADRAQAERGDAGAPFWYAGVSVGGAVGLRLLLDVPERLCGAALICTAAKFGEPAQWHERADLVQAAGTPTQVVGSTQRWFGPGFVERRPDVVLRLLGSLQTADRFGYAAVCRALATYDVRDRLGPIDRPVLAIAGSDDGAAPPARLEEIVAAVPGARFEVLDGVAHLAPAESPERVTALVRELVAGKGDGMSTHDDGMTVRREVAGLTRPGSAPCVGARRRLSLTLRWRP
ncbi:alpha/beta fold hydrolase [Xylanimonas sp. McL0601]|uniref:alpha/beta fold hydrolase n=1 Tax=Xylanimonas sp. McL0601 TaxID=3414739 RepID=UPI003CEC98DC